MNDLGWICQARNLVLSSTDPSRLGDLKARVGVQVKADKFNKKMILVGGNDVNADNSYTLHPGEVSFFPLENAKFLWLLAVSDQDKACYFVI